MNLDQAVSLINKSVRELHTYHLEAREYPVKLNQNENPFDVPQNVKQRILDYCLERPWNRYPSFVPERLKESLAAYTGLTASHVIVGNGSNEMLLVLLLALSHDHRPVIICRPTFTVYSLLASGLGRESKTVSLAPDLSFDVEAVCRAARQNPGSMLILCSPNNPTGSCLEESDLRTILGMHEGFLVLDQAYVEFGGYDGVQLLEEFPNLIITRTFSKALGGAGLRLGYLLGAPSIIAEINKIKLPYNINFFSEHVAAELVGHQELITTRVAEIVERREALYSFLQSLPFRNVYPSSANFILVRVDSKDALFDFLCAQGILIRDVSGYPMLEGCLRIGVGTEDEDSRLRKALMTYFG